MYGVQGKKKEGLFKKYWPLIRRNRKLILSVFVVVALLSGWRIFTLPDLYKAEVLLVPVGEQDKRIGGRLGRFAGLAAVTGVSLDVGRSSSRVNLAILKSRTFLEFFVEKNKLKTILFAKQWDAENKSWRKKEPRQSMVYRKLKRAVKVTTNKKTGLTKVTVIWKDVAIAATWANDLVASLNDYLRQQALQRSNQRLGYLNDELAKTRVAEVRQALFELISREQRKTIMISSQKQYAFRVLDAAVAPNKPFKKSKRRMLFMVIQLSILVGFLTLIWKLGYRSGRKSVR